MGVQIVRNQDDFFGIRIFNVEKVLNFMRPIDHGAVFFGPNTALACQWFAKHEDASGAIAFVFMVIARWFSWFWWQWDAGFLD